MRGLLLALSAMLLVGCSTTAPQEPATLTLERVELGPDWIWLGGLYNPLGLTLEALQVEAWCELQPFSPVPLSYEGEATRLQPGEAKDILLHHASGPLPHDVGGPLSCSLIAVDPTAGVVPLDRQGFTIMVPVPEQPEPTPAPQPGIPLEPR